MNPYRENNTKSASFFQQSNCL